MHVSVSVAPSTVTPSISSSQLFIYNLYLTCTSLHELRTNRHVVCSKQLHLPPGGSQNPPASIFCAQCVSQRCCNHTTQTLQRGSKADEHETCRCRPLQQCRQSIGFPPVARLSVAHVREVLNPQHQPDACMSDCCAYCFKQMPIGV